jgi:hypothetical protein
VGRRKRCLLHPDDGDDAVKSYDGKEVKRSWVIAWIGVGIVAVTMLFLWI